MTLEMTVATTTALLDRRPTAMLSRACACGQELDCCHAAHCPRCGITLKH